MRPRPEPVEWMAWQVISGPGTVDERRTQLLQLLDTSPDNATVRAYLGDLDVEEDLVNRVLGEEWGPPSNNSPSASSADAFGGGQREGLAIGRPRIFLGR